MQFISFVKQNAGQGDIALKRFAEYALADAEFPLSSDPQTLAFYLYDKLDHVQTKGFQVFMMLYKQMEPENILPALLKDDERAFLDAINIIVDLQNGPPMPKATRPLEYVCFFPVEVPTQEGDAYIFIAVDAYSEFLFQIGVELSNDNETVLKHIRMLTMHKDFIKPSNNGFTLVLHKYGEIGQEIDSIIKPMGGRFMINDAFLTSVITPVIEHIYKSMSGRK